MLNLTRFLTGLWLLLPSYTLAQQHPEIPPICSDIAGTVAVLDCLQNQQDILKRVLEYQQLVAKIAQFQTLSNSAPEVSSEEPSTEPDPGMDRLNWFDQNLEIYAIVGSPDELVAYARLDGREYRLKEGDTIRLARVTKVRRRQVHLLVSGHAMSVGLSGRSQTIENKDENQL